MCMSSQYFPYPSHKVGYQGFERNLVLKYHDFLHKHIERRWSSWTSPHLVRHTGMLSRLSRNLNRRRRYFGSTNQNQGKGAPKPQNKGQIQGGEAQDKLLKPQAKNNTTKPKKDMGKWCEFHKSSTHNTTECWAKQSLVAEMRAYESDACSH
jgi:hypothetical protein